MTFLLKFMNMSILFQIDIYTLYIPEHSPSCSIKLQLHSYLFQMKMMTLTCPTLTLVTTTHYKTGLLAVKMYETIEGRQAQHINTSNIKNGG